MRTLIGVTLCTFLLLGGCSKSDDTSTTSENTGDVTLDVIDTAKTDGADAGDTAEAAGNEAIDQASDMAAVEAEKASNEALEDASETLEK